MHMCFYIYEYIVTIHFKFKYINYLCNQLINESTKLPFSQVTKLYTLKYILYTLTLKLTIYTNIN